MAYPLQQEPAPPLQGLQAHVVLYAQIAEVTKKPNPHQAFTPNRHPAPTAVT